MHLTDDDLTSTCSADFLGSLLGVDKSWVHRLAKSGVFIKAEGGRGRFLLQNSVINYVNSLRERAAKKVVNDADGENVDPSLEQALLNREKRRWQEMENAKRAGELVELEMVRTALLALQVEYNTQLESLPSRLAGELAGMTEPALIRARLKAEMHIIRENTAAGIKSIAET